MRVRLGLVSLVASLLVFGTAAEPTSAVAAARPQHQKALAVLSSTTTPVIARSIRLGPVAGSQPLSLGIGLRLRNLALLNARVAGLDNPRSPFFDRLMTPAETTASFGPTKAQLATVEGYLRSKGVSIGYVAPERNFVTAKATVATAERAFGVRFSWWRDPLTHRVFYSNDADPVFSAPVARLLSSITGLDDYAQPPRLSPARSPSPASSATAPRHQTVSSATKCITSPPGGPPSGGCAEPAGYNHEGYSPAQLQSAYGVAQLAASNLCGSQECNGTGQAVGIFARGTTWSTAAETAFKWEYGLTGPSAKPRCPKGVSCPLAYAAGSDVALEADLDVDMVHALAPGAQVIVFEVPETVNFEADLMTRLSLDASIDETPVTSISYAECETDWSKSVIATTLHDEFQLMASHGQHVFASSGDYGLDCQSVKQGKLIRGVATPASDPDVIAVGGTNLFLNSNNSYGFEYVWSESGGGHSEYFSRPSWQDGAEMPSTATYPGRLVPDVGAEATCISSQCKPDNGQDYDIKGFAVGCAFATTSSTGGLYRGDNGGTSCATPLWAAVATIYDEYAAANGKIGLPATEIHPLLYTLATKPHPYEALTNVSLKAEDDSQLFDPPTPCTSGPCWNGASGLGSPRLYQMVEDLPGLSVSPTSGPPGTPVEVSGSSYLSGETVVVIGASKIICSGTVQTNGTFSCNGDIPSTANAGSLDLVGSGNVSDEQAMTTFNVTTTPGWQDAIEVPGSAELNTGGEAQINSLSCASAGNCSAGGYYYDGTDGGYQAFVVNEVNGIWQDAIEVPGSAELNTGYGDGGGDAEINSVSCASAANCSAGGFYESSNGQQAFVVNEVNGTWQDAIEVPGSAELNVGDDAQIISISCASAGICSAGGFYEDDGSGNAQAFVVNEVNGTWQDAIEVPGSAELNAAGYAEAYSVSCASAGNCSAGGSYWDDSAHLQAFVVNEVNGTWQDAIEVPGSAELNVGGAQINSVSCGSAGNCSAGGFYQDSSGNAQAFVVNEVNGTWRDAIEVPGSAELSVGGAQINSVSCASAGNCSAGGFYQDSSGKEQAFVVNEVNGTWRDAIEVPGIADSNVGGAPINSVSCGSAGNCSAGGSYQDNSGNSQAFVVNEVNGTWQDPIEVPGSAKFNVNGDAETNSVSCASAGNCSAGGFYQGASGGWEAFVVNEG